MAYCKVSGRAALVAALFLLTLFLLPLVPRAGGVLSPLAGLSLMAPVAAETAQPGQAVKTEDLSIVGPDGKLRHTFHVELALDDRHRAVGLMFRTKLADDAGMLFWYAKPRPITMWMRNTYIPLDMVFIGSDGTVMRVEHDAVPFSEDHIESGGPAQGVLEIAGGDAVRFGIQAGDKVRHRLFAGK